jgi:hypothetical protein
VSRVVTVDLDNPADVERLVNEQRHHTAAREAEPELYRAIVAKLSSLPHGDAEQIAQELGHAVRPSAVLAGHFRALIADRPALGHYLKAG